MSLRVRFMREGEEEAIAVLVRRLPKDLGKDFVPLITGQSLRDAKGVIEVTIADDAGLMLGLLPDHARNGARDH